MAFFIHVNHGTISSVSNLFSYIFAKRYIK